MQKVKEFFKSKGMRRVLMMCMAMSVMAISCFAEDGSGASIDTAGITAAFTNGFNSMVTNSIAMISAMVPIALSLAGVTFLVRKAMGWFKGMAK